MAKLKLGVDVGGTFTDVVGINEDGKVYFARSKYRCSERN